MWLSKVRSMARVFKIYENWFFLLKKQTPLEAHFGNTEWIEILVYLSDIFKLLNELNLPLLGKIATVFSSADKIAAFKTELELWKKRVNTGIFYRFQTLEGIMATG